MNDLERDLEELDRRFGPVEQTTADAMRNAKIRIADAEAVVEDLLANVFVLQDVVGQLSHEVVRLKECIRGDDENSDAEDDSLLVSLLNRVEEGYGWLPSRQRAVAQRRSRHAQRVKAREFGLYAKEQELATAKEEETKMVKQLEFAQKELALCRKNYKKLRGDHVMALQSILAQLGISKTAYFGHAYIGKYCFILSTMPIAMAITQPFFLRFPRKAGETRRQYNARMKHNAQYQEMYWARHNWIHRFVKWGQIHQLVTGSFDYVERPELLELLRIRTASYSGFFAKHFPKDKPTPKQYFALTHAVEFLAENDFSGEGDEQPMETLHHEWNRLWVKSRHCVQRKMALEHCLNSMHVRNNVKILVLADKAQS
uniref:Uncharacterized protein n=1 Tax=Eutreptiella gymnastica TaxID=73025 RepID=A0A6T1YVL7_9EUGL